MSNHDAEAVRLLAEALRESYLAGHGEGEAWDTRAEAILAALDGEIVPKGTLAAQSEDYERLDMTWDERYSALEAQVAALREGLLACCPDCHGTGWLNDPYVERCEHWNLPEKATHALREARALLASGEPVEPTLVDHDLAETRAAIKQESERLASSGAINVLDLAPEMEPVFRLLLMATRSIESAPAAHPLLTDAQIQISEAINALPHKEATDA